LLLVLVLLVLQAGVCAQELRQEQLQQERYELEQRKRERAADRVYSSSNRWSSRSPLTRCETISFFLRHFV
jgi:hypothetical protein